MRKFEDVVTTMEEKDKALEAMELTAKRMESERLQQQAHEVRYVDDWGGMWLLIKWDSLVI